MRVRQVLSIAALLAAGSQQLQAQQATPKQWVFGFSVGSMAIEPTTAAASQVGDRSWGLQLDGGVLLNRFFYLGADLGGQFLDDKASFTQNTTAGEKKSTANVTYLSAVAGLRSRTLPAVPVALGVNAGFSGAMAKRSIDNCVDCNVDELKIPGGAFVEPTVLLGRKFAKVRLTGRYYLSGDGMRNVISAGVDFQPKRK